jgi:hypothetical protein
VYRHLAALLLAAFLLAFSSAPALAAPPLTGVWRITEIHIVGPDLDATNPSPQPSVYIFTPGYYSMVWCPGKTPRQDSATLWHPTDEEKVRDFNTIVVNTGTYELHDSTLVIHPLAAKTPEYVGGWATYTWRMDGEVLLLEHHDTFARDGTADAEISDYHTTLRLTRVE